VSRARSHVARVLALALAAALCAGQAAAQDVLIRHAKVHTPARAAPSPTPTCWCRAA
jgi:hypothetical protein